ncbi:crispr-associated protein cas5 family [Melioribacter roseus P3M-2]|uniref:Crispr-associated protein cas5 family n=1 Tax=Melioribacter roseus (strain DSM 23840 / JCM 17771 / VKM B-2668 / P3M-2) TaxID=1191523 RepID=I6ZPT2_MELRP|nr:type I-B CRISPR-associated protein Cas5b [Melioribacter roseus]AFN74054.1 crispr-associated protein cas5 family [Melioribacter roseus P3M-2]
MHLLRIKIYQPNAHYRLPFAYQRRHTYPLPPYSTVIGFLINAMGIWDQRDSFYKEGIRELKISLAGKFDSKITEYIWFRNMSKKAHFGRFSYLENRENNGTVEHPGGQSPMRIDVLNDVHLLIYLGHEDIDVLKRIREEISNPINRLEILHLGRAEDWIVLEEEPKLIDDSQIAYERYGGNFKYFFWIPRKFYIRENESWCLISDDEFANYDGLMYNLPTFSTIEGYEKNYNRHGKRTFEYVRTKLNDGLIIGQRLMIDKELNLPFFLGDLNDRN